MEIEEKDENIEVEEWLKSKVINPAKVLEYDDKGPSRLIPYACAVELENLFRFYTCLLYTSPSPRD